MDDYNLRVQLTYKRLYDSKPASVLVIRAAGGTAPADTKKEGFDDRANIFKPQLGRTL